MGPRFRPLVGFLRFIDSCNDLLHNFAMDIGEAEVSTLKAESEFFMIDA